MMDPIKKVSIIGSGNLATNLAIELKRKGIKVAQIYSNSLDNAKILAGKIDAAPIKNLSDLEHNLDLIFLSVSDNAYENVLNQIKLFEIPIVHTAGSIPLEIFRGKFQHFGVFYPFQTFSKERVISFENIPVCIEANSEKFLNQLSDLGKSVSKTVYKLTSQQRRKLHLSGIISNNFSNFLFTLAADYLEKEGMEFKILLPLIGETIEKLKYLPPKSAQTGPASRGNKNIIEKHKELLKNDKQLFKLYSLLSENILDYYGKS